MDDATRQALRALPSVDEAIRRFHQHTTSEAGDRAIVHWAIADAVRAEIDGLRRAVLSGEIADRPPQIEPERVLQRARELVCPSLRPVLNATGVVLHTNLGRAPLAEAALQRIVEVARSYSNLEYRLEDGRRGHRHDHVSRLLCALTGAERALVVNNNAAAVLLCLSALASGRSVIVSRGELIEIGGSFRLPDVMTSAGAALVEVGTTNRTHLADYESGIDETTALLLKVHRSNFALVGFTAEVDPSELVELGRDRQLPVMFDLGSGTLLDAPTAAREPTVREVVALGCDLVTFSGDKLLGGPQAGLIVGRAAAIDALRSHPLMRALRPDKLCLAALEATLERYRDGDAPDSVPALRMLRAPERSLRQGAEKLLRSIAARARRDGATDAADRSGSEGTLVDGWHAATCSVSSRAGGGALPDHRLSSWAVAISHPRRAPQQLASALRTGDPPVIARIERGRLLLDVRCLGPAELEPAADAVVRATLRLAKTAL